MSDIDSHGPPAPPIRSVTPGRVRLRTLVLLRWLAVSGQTFAVLVVYFGAHFPLPLFSCFAVIAASVALNILVSVRFPFAKRLSNREASLYLGFDLVQLFALLLLTGGLENPFAILFLAPVAISATSLDLRSTVALGLLGLLCVTVLGFFHLPIPWNPEAPLVLPPLYVAGIWAALVLGLAFTAGYAWRIAEEADRMITALEATRAALAREHRLSALGGLAAAAAHELGTPLATIALVAKELERDLASDSPLTEDVALLRSQAARCREILSDLSRKPEEGDALTAHTSLGALLDEVAAPHQGFGVALEVELNPAIDGAAAKEPDIWRQPEIIHGLRNLIENAVDFASTAVVVRAYWTAAEITIRISDDGPGIAPEILARLGEPYVSTRRAEDTGADPDEAFGMGLGFFIAKTLLERTGAQIDARNLEAGGAEIAVTWSRQRIEVAGAAEEA